jgi:hypothetical protein
VSVKEYGKAKIFLINQSRFPTVDNAQLDALDEEINNHREEFNKLAETTKELEKSLKECSGSFSNQ